MSAEERPSAISGQHRGSRGKPIGVLIGGGIGALAAYAGMRLGDAYGSLLPLGAGVIGAVLGGGVSAVFKGNADTQSKSQASAEAAGGVAGDKASPSQASEAPISAGGSPAAGVSNPQETRDLSPGSEIHDVKV